MDTPLLALTSRPAAPPLPPPDLAAADNMRQLVQLRWIAVGGQLLTILAVGLGLHVRLPIRPMLGILALLVLANIVGSIFASRRRTTNVEIMLALLLDIGALTAQLSLSGGATNPFISFYLLQVVLGAILLELWSAWILVGFTSLCYAGLSIGSVPLVYPAGLTLRIAHLHLLGAWISFALTAALLGLFITRTTRNLRARDRYLADLRQHAAEEDGIVRMGLFASGAAHELGTPLASLSVILGDWRRMPKLARDPVLAGELEEMRGEVERCKAIVTDILHSAGEPRGDEMESIDARGMLDAVAAEWRPTHPAVPLGVTCEELDGAAVVAGASLRQALWSLLDNAAAVSPHFVAVRATRTDEALTVAVIDRGPGFSAAQLGAVGKPYQSTKGAGRGLGLFLAANVARRLGGRLEAANRPGGGAMVSLVLPLASDRPPLTAKG